jgi:hypothetical protein
MTDVTDSTTNSVQSSKRQVMRFTRDGFLAIKLPPANKVEAQMVGGLAVARQKHDVIKAALAMDYPKCDVQEGDLAILRGDAGFKAWAREVFIIDGHEFVLCPEQDVLGFEQLF